ncbi:MAG TPA: hypothetical protein VJ948_07930 [Acidimicrobiia bacterium]|nr:hypothetical protein [Acidimicrobiia bacterium]
MTDRPPEQKPDDKNGGATVGVWTAMGAALGVVVFAITGDAYWIAVGAGVGVALGAGIWGQRSKSSDE